MKGLIIAATLIIESAIAQNINYQLVSPRPLSRFRADQIKLLAKLNHADPLHLAGLSRIVVPDRWDSDELLYSPMPKTIEQLHVEYKAIVVDLTAQVFGAYEWGNLVHWGPVCSGDRRHPTPSGTYHLNWRARVHTSTEDRTWVMPWYFNFDNDQGLALHEYSMPGRPASHGCVRMLAADARWLFDWGEEWTIGEDTREVTRPGTLVLLVGDYDFTSAQPWLQPEWWDEGVALPRDLYNNAYLPAATGTGSTFKPSVAASPGFGITRSPSLSPDATSKRSP